MNVAELSGAQLDWAVARVEDLEIRLLNNGTEMTLPNGDWWYPSESWAQGGPIIERERLDVYGFDGENWCANDNLRATQYGPTPLIAAMRCYVASKLGDEVEIPAELMEV